MGGAQAAKVMQIVAEQKWARQGIEPDEKTRMGVLSQAKMIEFGLEMLSEAMFCSARLMDDGIIDPRDTRRVLQLLVAISLQARRRGGSGPTYGIQRL